MNRVHVEPVSRVRAGNLQEHDYLHKLELNLQLYTPWGSQGGLRQQLVKC